MQERRRCARVAVPKGKLTCYLSESKETKIPLEFLINNINMLGISFIANQRINKNSTIRLKVKFPFASFDNEGNVWGKVVYSNKIPDMEKYAIGIEFIKNGGGSRA